MIGPDIQVGDIELQLEELVMPANLLSDEVLSPDEDEEEELQIQPYKIDSRCKVCNSSVRLFVAASDQGIRRLQQLLFADLSFICTPCSRVTCRQNGRQ
ncbi:E7 [Human papillomavirus 130]|uniref:Protein E7 n=1 Tax=Human papillomavirus 130 TaxID=909329 RepID=E7BQ80_9PAPI|nr:E7 [Human papillomavirus 130]